MTRDEARAIIKATRPEMEARVKAALLADFRACLNRVADEEVRAFLYGTGQKPQGVLP